MSRIIAVANQKGGVGKTTTSINLSSALANSGKKILVIDLDPQANTTSGLGIDKSGLEFHIYDILLGKKKLYDVLLETRIENLSLLPSHMVLAGAEIELIGAEKREYILKKILLDVKYTYDFIIIDCPPSLNILTVNALTASDTVLVPIQCEYFALEGLTQLIYTIELIKKNLNKRLKIEGLVFTMFDARTNLSAQVVDEVKHHLKHEVYKSVIPRNIRLAEAPSHGLPIDLYDPDSKGAIAYKDLAKEVILKKF